MILPKFLLADNSKHEDVMYVLHTEYPRFIMDVTTDEVEFFEELEEDQETDDFKTSMIQLIEEALAFYDHELNNLLS
jgi:hypothetical protein